MPRGGGPRTKVRPVWAPLAFVLALSGPVGATAAGGAPDEAWVQYASGSELEGAFTGSCGARGVSFSALAGETLGEASGGTLRVFTTWSNDSYTLGAVGPPLWTAIDRHQTHKDYPVPAGRLVLVWRPESRAVLLASDSGHAALPRVEFEGSRLTLGPSEGEVVSGLAYHRLYDYGPVRDWVPSPVLIPGPSRAAALGDASTRIAGDLAWVLDSATVRFPDGNVVALPPFRELASSTGVAGVWQLQTSRWTHAQLTLANARLAVDSGQVTARCAQLEATHEGSLFLHSAWGRVSSGFDRVDFKQRELTLRGSMRIEETVEDSPPRGPTTLSYVWGRFDAVGIDYGRSEVVGSGWPVPLAKAGLFGLVLAALAAALSQSGRIVGFFFTRFDSSSAARHPARALILGLVRDNPGIGARELSVQAGLNYSVLRHHVHVLETVGLLKALRGPDAKHLYERGASLAEARRRLVLERDRLVGFLHERARTGPVSRREAGRALRARFGVSRVGAWKAVRRALAVGALVAEASPAGERLLAGRWSWGQAGPAPAGPTES